MWFMHSKLQGSIFPRRLYYCYVPKKNKAVILLSTMHHGISIVEEDTKKRPEIIKFYNETKIGVDLVHQMV